MRLPALLIEAFAAGPCAGNGAAVVRLECPLDDRILQGLARTLNQSETAFLEPKGVAWGLRWFTPTCEVPLCGHATLAALLALGHWGLLRPGEATSLQTLSGELRASLGSQQTPGASPSGAIELPYGQLLEADCPPYLCQLLRSQLAGEVQLFWRSELGYSVGLLSPDAPLDQADGLAALMAGALSGPERQGLVLMQALDQHSALPRPTVSGKAANYQLRFFAPGLGIAEDPVTGSAHALVAPYWLELLGENEVVGWQCSSRPGGMVLNPTAPGWMRIQGSGHVLWDGVLNLPDGSPE
ncbi:PhzF family phenazine biosynthesis protein [Cyanobium sp. WAJ14-Wanaka]|uniref:PhzF family phenazine biosynthesis protein n=1 Tax=Cyanobium sp. WAJ14-Wanaka TaxID=2823725 RepID=UPI0020CC83ED|nr:PhzF family phenazine biosynthesis protein [Cyanobium sp. WAJ14-Wanaka]MCP9774543.1 PhzF family phenazine biosynthesis protein [Cyanobium sp. WAJ14-Wanaka]